MFHPIVPTRRFRSGLALLAFATGMGLFATLPATAEVVISGQSQVAGRGIYVDLERNPHSHIRYGDRVPTVRISEPGTTIRVIRRSPYSRYNRPSRVIIDSTLVNPVVVDSTIIDSTLVNPVIVESDRYGRYRHREPRRISIPMSSDLENCIELGNLQRACYRY
ncbi:MAG: hypothetical protein ACFE0J_03450 [Elainellaceae cyanobacterium]